MANPFFDGIGKVIGKVADNIQGRVERLKNEKERLINERKEIMCNPPNAKSTDRVVAIGKRLCEIETIISNKASD